MFSEEADGSLPRQLCGCLVVARCRVIVKTVLGTGVLMHFMTDTRAIEHVGAQFGLIEFGLHFTAIVVVARISAEREQTSGGERQKAFDRRVIPAFSIVVVSFWLGSRLPVNAIPRAWLHRSGLAIGARDRPVHGEG